MSMIERGELRLSQALGNGKNGAVDKADLQVGVGLKQINCALVVAGRQILDLESSSAHLIEDGDEGLLSGEAAEEVIHLDKDGGGDDSTLLRSFDQGGANAVGFVASIERADEDAGVEDQRNGGGSYTSRLANSLRSPRPDSNIPMQVTGGCSPSAGPSSCSSAWRTSWGTPTPR
ncbi:MAG TPA: hypothetical protein VHR18_14610 [Solirubrobacterales bacterium]|nr:hypothetical protein [Solirubrobacterales bacterium]